MPSTHFLDKDVCKMAVAVGSTNKTNIILWLWWILRNKKNVAFTLVISELTWIMFMGGQCPDKIVL